MLFLLFFSLKSPPSQILAFSLNLKSCADKTYRFNKTFLLVLPSHLGYLSGRRTSSISKHTGDVSVPISNSSLGPQVISSFLISQPRSMCPENDCRIKTRKFKFVKFFFFLFFFHREISCEVHLPWFYREGATSLFLSLDLSRKACMAFLDSQ